MKSDEILIKTFDQVKNDNFDQVKFDQVIVCPFSSKKYQKPKDLNLQLYPLPTYFATPGLRNCDLNVPKLKTD
jgi:hypothetical protein